jgi:hypothetical protein
LSSTLMLSTLTSMWLALWATKVGVQQALAYE